MKGYRWGGQYTRLGGPPMPLQTRYLMSTLFLTAPGSGGSFRAGGTAFFVHVPTIQRHWYLVTAKHNVEGRDDICVRLGQGAETSDFPVPQEAWVHHTKTDVSVAPLTALSVPIQMSARMYHAAIPIGNVLAEPAELNLLMGSDVFFLGLLRNLPQMEGANIPIVRSGTVALLNQSNVKVKDHRTQIVSVLPSAHLIDCRAYNGMSGAPCVSQRLDIRVSDGKTDLITVTHLFGVICSHFDETAQGTSVGHAYPIHTGVGVVTPIRYVKELLMENDDLKDAREASDKELQQGDDPEEGIATADSGFDEASPTADFLGKLMEVPKSEADEVHRNHEP
jgi:hypothetical protein